MSYSLPMEVLFGLYLGALTGVVPALVAWTLGFVFRYVTSVSVPGFGVVVLSVAIAGVQGGLLGLLEPAVGNSPIVVVALIVVMLSSQYAHARGDAMGAAFPRRIGLRQLRENRLSSDVIERVGRFGQVRVRVTGDVGDIEGYPPLPDDLRTAISEDDWTFPGDLPIAELESRLADRLRTDYDLADVTVEIDTRGTATVHAAPPEGMLSRRVPPPVSVPFPSTPSCRRDSPETTTWCSRSPTTRLVAPSLAPKRTVVARRTPRTPRFRTHRRPPVATGG